MLTEAQKSVLQHCGVWSRLAGNYYYESGDGVQLRTLKVLVNKGILSDEAAPFRYWLTDKGFTIRKDMITE